MSQYETRPEAAEDGDAVTNAMLTASRLLVAVSIRSLAARHRAEIAAIDERLTPTQRLALIEALTAFNEAGGEPLSLALDDQGPHPLGWVVDAGGARDT